MSKLTKHQLSVIHTELTRRGLEVYEGGSIQEWCTEDSTATAAVKYKKKLEVNLDIDDYGSDEFSVIVANHNDGHASLSICGTNLDLFEGTQKAGNWKCRAFKRSIDDDMLIKSIDSVIRSGLKLLIKNNLKD